MSDHQSDTRPELPFNALPPMVVAIALVLGGIELVFQLGTLGLIGGADAVGWRIAAMEDYGFFDVIFEAMRAQGQWPLEHLLRFLSYAFIHYSFTHALMVLVFILALGKMVGETFGNLAVLVIFAVATVAGSLVYGLAVNTQVQLVGAYPAAYGFVGAYTFILWIGLGRMQESRIRAFTLIGFLMGLQLVFGLMFGGTPDWIADLSGFVAGFVTAALLVPGAFGRIVARLRAR
ncbi:rhomboid family intramembrane serine protease [Celeribacter indicus]|nr:rhomboid family intramembrane serine protease [Celeribacter indicus]SDX08264.1 Rhomboid family protein [Celeribacter indicus]